MLTPYRTNEIEISAPMPSLTLCQHRRLFFFGKPCLLTMAHSGKCLRDEIEVRKKNNREMLESFSYYCKPYGDSCRYCGEHLQSPYYEQNDVVVSPAGEVFMTVRRETVPCSLCLRCGYGRLDHTQKTEMGLMAFIEFLRGSFPNNKGTRPAKNTMLLAIRQHQKSIEKLRQLYQGTDEEPTPPPALSAPSVILTTHTPRIPGKCS